MTRPDFDALRAERNASVGDQNARAVDDESPSFQAGFDLGRGESEFIVGLIRDPKCVRCGARNAQEAEAMCRPSDDSCPGSEWPLERLWALATPPAAQADSVPMPQNEDDAAAMAVLGESWLRHNAPHRLKTAAQAGDGVVGWRENFGMAYAAFCSTKQINERGVILNIREALLAFSDALARTQENGHD